MKKDLSVVALHFDELLNSILASPRAYMSISIAFLGEITIAKDAAERPRFEMHA